MDAVATSIEEARRAPIRGWDWSWLDGRAEMATPSWRYPDLVRSRARAADRVLDIDTGGGEVLAALGPFPCVVVATEGYGPNVPVAGERLSSAGVSLVHAHSAPDNVDQPALTPESSGSALPFSSAAFDLVVCRHSPYWPAEVHRVLDDGGSFITQQFSDAPSVGTAWGELFRRPVVPRARFDLAFATAQLADHGFDIVAAEEEATPITFFDLAGVVYYLRMVPWEVEGFDAVADEETLRRIHRRIRDEGSLIIRGAHMLIEATKTGGR